MEENKIKVCSLCKERPHVGHKIVNWLVCEQCHDTLCHFCRKPVTTEEMKSIPRAHSCVQCYVKRLQKEKDFELCEVLRKYDFQIKFQTCARCGQVNDSRNESGEVDARFCIQCRKNYGTDKMLDRFERKRPLQPKDNRIVVFDSVVGFKHR